MEQRDSNACGAHKLGEAIPGSYFDYTCDDCMLPYTLEPDMIDRHGKRYALYKEYMEATNGYENPAQGIHASTKSKKTRPKARVSNL